MDNDAKTCSEGPPNLYDAIRQDSLNIPKSGPGPMQEYSQHFVLG